MTEYLSLGLINIHHERYDDKTFFNRKIDDSINLFASYIISIEKLPQYLI
jgi:hypothetical protein